MPASSDEPGGNPIPVLGWAEVVCLAVLVLLGRIPDLFYHFRDWDEAAMMAQSWAMTQGQLLYKDIPQFHPVLQFALMASFFRILRPEWVPLALKTMNLLLVFVGALLVTRIANGWLANRTLSLLGGCIFVFYCSRDWAVTSYGEFYTMFPILLSVWLLFFATRARHFPYCYLTGLLWGVAFFFKQVAIFDAIGLYLAYLCLFQAPKRSKVVATGLMALGFLSVAVFIAVYFLDHGTLLESWNSMFVRSILYTHSARRFGFTLALGVGLVHQLGLSLTAIPGIVYLVSRHRGQPGGKDVWGAPFFFVLLAWLFWDLVALYSYGRFMSYYLLQLVPLASLLPLFTISLLELRVRRAVWISFVLSLGAVLCLDFVAEMSYLRAQQWVPPEVKRSVTLADYLRRHTGDEDRIFVYAAENVDVFFLARRLSNNGIYQFVDMVANHTHDQAEQERATREFLSNLPAIIIVDPVKGATIVQRGFDLPVIDDLLKKHYVLESTLGGLQLYRRVCAQGEC